MGIYYTLADARGCLERYADSAKQQAHASWDKDSGHGMPVILTLTDVREGLQETFYVEGPFNVKGTPLRALAEQAE